MQTKITVEFSDKDIRDLLIDKAREALKDKSLPGSTASVVLTAQLPGNSDHPVKVDGVVTFNGIK